MTEPAGRGSGRGATTTAVVATTRPAVDADGFVADIARVVATFGAALRAAGLPAGPDRCERFARAITVLRPGSVTELRACGLAAIVSAPDQIEVFDRVFAEVFGDRVDPTVPDGPAEVAAGTDRADGEAAVTVPLEAMPSGMRPSDLSADGRSDDEPDDEPAPDPWHALASATERLGERDFADLSLEELRTLETLMRKLALATPLRRTRRYRSSASGNRADLRATLREARRTGGEPLRLARRAVRVRPRRLVVLCDISGSMEPYARAMLQLIYCASIAPRSAGPGVALTAGTEVFTFATRLTRITDELASAPPGAVLDRAGKAAPDWSGGTRIGLAVKHFNDRFGCRGMARGAVVLIISDGWETDDPARLAAQMARLSRVAYRIVWANPRTKSPRYRPEVRGMAAAWPYCDAVVSAHSLHALDDLLSALARSA